MKLLTGTVLLAWAIVIGASSGEGPPQSPKATRTTDAPAVLDPDNGAVPPPPGAPQDKPRVVSREGAEYLRKLRKNTPFGTNGFDLEGLRAGMGSRREPRGAKNVQLIRTKIGEIPAEWVLAPGADPDLRLLYLHGGGFVSGSAGFYLTMAAHISSAARCAVLLPDYRLAPEHPLPAGIEDCVAAHEWMIANGPSGPARARATFIAGDSAGGSLTLATLLALRDRRLPMPVAGIPLSPTTDLTLASESLKTVDDPIISSRTMPRFRDLYLGETDPRNPLASPVFGDYKGIPPLLIQVGEHEMLRDDSIRVAKKARADGIQVKLEVWPGMFHVFQSHEPLLPEAREAIRHMADFMQASLPEDLRQPNMVADRLKQKVDLDFNRTPLQEAFSRIGDEIWTTIEIEGDALKSAGYTKNMPQTMKAEQVTAVQAIAKILQQYQNVRNPGQSMVIVVDEDKKRIRVTTEAFCQKQNLQPYDVTK